MANPMQISRKIANQLLHWAQCSPDREICGLLAGINNQPTRCYRVKNVAENPQQRFLLDPAGQIDAMRSIREQHEQLLAIFHSHPHAPAQPSATDLEYALYPDVLNLIISLNTKGLLEMRGFIINNKIAEEVTLTLIE